MPNSLPILRSGVTCLLIAQLIIPGHLRAQQDAPSMASPPAASQPTTPLNPDEKILQVLNRFTYGPRPGDLERVRAMGLSAWFTQQFNPVKIDDSALESRLAAYPAMQLPLNQLIAMYPTRAMVRATMDGKASAPGGEAEHAIYADQAAREKAKKNKDQPPPTDKAVLAPEDVQALLDLPPDRRFSALCRMKLPQLHDFRQSLTPDQRRHLTDGFTAQQIEQLAAFNNPEAVIAAEDIQAKLLRDIYTERQLSEVMVDFWLNHFNVYIKKSQQAPYYIASYERDAIRPHALGRFEDLLVATATSPAMLNYLDNSSSIGPHSRYASRPFADSKKKPDGLNENYARELMELHTVGVNGGYTQHDVTEVAKVFTGWTVGPKFLGPGLTGPKYSAGEALQAQFDWSKHEPGSKQVLGVTIKESGEKEGLQVLHMLATSPKTAQFISTKLAIRFVSDDPSPVLVDRMAKTFLSSNGDIRRVLLTMVNSPDFWSRSNYRSKIKTPQDFVVSAVRASNADVTTAGALVNVISDLGMPLYGMQTPNGYSMKADAWNNTAALVERMNFALALSSNRVAGVVTDWPLFLASGNQTPLSQGSGEQVDSLTPEAKAAALEDKLLHIPISERTRQTILVQISTDPAQQESSLRQVAIKDRKRDPLDVAGPLRPTPNTIPLDPEAALAAGLLFGSPEFQRR